MERLSPSAAVLLFLYMLVLNQHMCSGLFYDWFGLYPSSSDEKVTAVKGGPPSVQVPFEGLSPEDKFLIEASRISGVKLSDLDVCKQKWILQLKSSCSRLSEEEMLRLGLNLMNCQSSVEGRKEFPCTDKMSLKDCIKGMDDTTLLTYHSTCNSTRAVCYLARYQHFRTMSELAVNNLMNVTKTHLARLTDMEEKLGRWAPEALERVIHSQRESLKIHDDLKVKQEGLRLGTAKSIDVLKKEVEAVGELGRAVGKVLGGVESMIANASKEIQDQSKHRRAEHETLIHELKQLSSLTSELQEKIGNGSRLLSRGGLETEAVMKSTLDSLREINSSVARLAEVVLRLHSQAEDRFLPQLVWLLGENGERLETGAVLFEHLAALLCAMLVYSFLNLPWLDRLLLAVVAPLNLYTTLAFSRGGGEWGNFLSVPLVYLYPALLAISAAGMLGRLAVRYVDVGRWKSSGAAGAGGGIEENDEDVHIGEEEDHTKVRDWLSAGDEPMVPTTSRRNFLVGSKLNGIKRFEHTLVKPLQDASGGSAEDEEAYDDNASSVSGFRQLRLRKFAASTPLNSLQPSAATTRSLADSTSAGDRTVCLGTTKAGARCRNHTAKPGSYCQRHSLTGTSPN